MATNRHSLFSEKPCTLTEGDMEIFRKWNGGRIGEKFRCYLCGYRFKVGDVARWQYTNDVKGAGGNPLVCSKCDGTKEEICAKMKANREEAEGRLWYFCRRSEMD